MTQSDGVPHDSMSYARQERLDQNEYGLCVGCDEYYHLDNTAADLVRCHDCLEWACVDCRSKDSGNVVCNGCLQRRESDRQPLTEYDSPWCP